jgi:hypothetical protein
MHGVGEKCVKKLVNLKGRDQLEDPGVDGSNIKMDIKEIELDGVDWACLTQENNWWQAFVNMVMN